MQFCDLIKWRYSGIYWRPAIEWGLLFHSSPTGTDQKEVFNLMMATSVDEKCSRGNWWTGGRGCAVKCMSCHRGVHTQMLEIITNCNVDYDCFCARLYEQEQNKNTRQRRFWVVADPIICTLSIIILICRYSHYHHQSVVHTKYHLVHPHPPTTQNAEHSRWHFCVTTVTLCTSFISLPPQLVVLHLSIIMIC